MNPRRPAIRLVPDVNILVSSLTASPAGLLGRLHDRFRRHDVRYVLGPELLAELQRVLAYPRVVGLGVTPSLAFGLAADLLLLGEYVAPVPRLDWPTLTDRKDWHLLDLLYESAADHLITRDRRLLEPARALGMPALQPSDLEAAGIV